MSRQRYELVRVDGWPGRETIVVEGDSMEEALLKMMEKSGIHSKEEAEQRL